MNGNLLSAYRYHRRQPIRRPAHVALDMARDDIAEHGRKYTADARAYAATLAGK